MFVLNLVFCLFKRIASNEREERFLHEASFMVFSSFPSRKKILFEL